VLLTATLRLVGRTVEQAQKEDIDEREGKRRDGLNSVRGELQESFGDEDRGLPTAWQYFLPPHRVSEHVNSNFLAVLKNLLSL